MPEVKKPVCKNCGAEGHCNGRDVGALDYLDRFEFWCDNCGRIEVVEMSGGTPYSGSNSNYCPFCRSENDHGERAPKHVLDHFYRSSLIIEGDADKKRVN